MLHNLQKKKKPGNAFGEQKNGTQIQQNEIVYLDRRSIIYIS